jgi:crotonobetainyl-CoA:carnitine CoA-transferase CaiB-like acyl-CoA transferase
MEQPLEGVRIIDCGIYHAGPGGPAILGDLGAEVIKIERPKTGDPIRTIKRIGTVPLELPGGRSIFFEGANRNKKSITLDLSTSEGQAIIHRLTSRSDVFMTNMRRPAVESLNITYPVLKEVNPNLIYASVSAFGPKGPDRDQGGFDYQGQARSGFMYSLGEEGMPPLVSQFGIIDQATAIMTSHQILTALYMRERTGAGQEVHVSILGSATFLLYFNILISQMGGFEVPRHNHAIAHPMRNHYRCADGRWLMMTLTPPERYWGSLCRALGRPDLENDPRFDTEDKRFEKSAELVAIFDDIFMMRTSQEWLDIFPEYDLFCCGVNSFMELEHDPQIIENDYLTDLDHPTLGKIKIPGYPVHFNGNCVQANRAAPELGEHTDEILTAVGGYSRSEIERFREDGVI